MNKPLKIITALGWKPDLVLEIVDFFNGGERYKYNAEATRIRGIFANRKLAEIYLICTEDVTESLGILKGTIRTEYPDLLNHLHEIYLEGNDICCAVDDAAMRQKVYAEVQALSDGDLIIASGGRKQVTQRLIEAGLLYGCMGYLTLTAPYGKENRQNTLDFNVLLTTARQFSEERRNRIIKDEMGDNFRSLYLLPLQTIKQLQHTKIGRDESSFAADLTWLKKLPKADLHCHLGGAYDEELLKTMASALLDDLEVNQNDRKIIGQIIEQRLGLPISQMTAKDMKGKQSLHPLQNLDVLCRNDKDPEYINKAVLDPEYINKAVLVNGLSCEQIKDISRDGLPKEEWPKDLSWYMACGDLGGSTLLQTEQNLRLALRWLMNEALQENVRFMEVRFSPDNYTKAGLTIRQVIDFLLDEAEKFTQENSSFYVHFLIMATRHKSRAAMVAHVAAAVSYGQPGGGKGPRITGFDLAGQEEDNDPSQFKEVFMPLHYHFMNITIHAGEMASDDKIWQALYDLHARRVGHGLKLINNQKMMDYVRDYGIAIEMCPSSNIQTNNFRRFDQDNSGNIYPLKKYMEKGIAVTVNTDNRGISETTLTNEYLEAARLTEGGLSKWDILRLLKNGFKSAFLPKDEKDRLIKEIDDQIFSLILDEHYPL